MLLAGGPSDSGGGQGSGLGWLLDAAPLLVSVCALILGLYNFYVARKKDKEQVLFSFLSQMTGRDAIAFRAVLFGAGGERLEPFMADLPSLTASQRQRCTEIREAVHSLVLVVQSAPIVLKRAGVYSGPSPVGADDVLTQLAALVAELDRCTIVWAPYLGLDDDLEMANAALDRIHAMSLNQAKSSKLPVLAEPLHISTRFDAVDKRVRDVESWTSFGTSIKDGGA